ncbi:hypothetical protein C4D60_Mb05t20820 [Musa balbisiana]|uniref:Uncharacterized protein n=1 Tax=Musa balbisiana TaxID=52838 RepID=A0A4S8JXM9_MUSBA|nr:hypothetical protein C4D60_Mb05t20820 [Musa balbisiana]
MRSQHAATAPRPHAQPTRCLGPSPHAQLARCLGPSAPCAANTLPRPHAQPTRCHGPSAPCAASPLPRPLGPMRNQHAASAPCAANTLPRPLGPMRNQHAASAPRPHAQLARCLGPSAPCADSSLPRPLGPMRSQHAATAPRPHAQPTRCLGPSAPCRPRPHQRGLPACVVPLGLMSPEATPTRPARLRRAPRPHVARGHTNAACPPASCPSASCRPRPHQRGLPACVVPLGLMSPEATPTRPARLRRAPRPHVARGHTNAACPPASCPSASCRPRPHQRGLPACVVPLGLMSPEATPTRPARLRRAPRPHVARGHTNAACPPASCPSASCRPRPHQRGLPACVVPLGLMSPEATPTRPARLRRAPRPHVARGHTNAACPPASCPSASCRPRPHQRGLPACVVPLGLMSPEATPTRPARLRRAPRPHVARGHTNQRSILAWSPPSASHRPRSPPRGTAFPPHHLRSPILAILAANRHAQSSYVARGHTNAACPPASCPSASCRPRPHQRGLPACVVPLGLMSPEATPTRPARLRRAPRPHVARGHTNAACPPASCPSASCRPRPHQRGLPACVVPLGLMSPEATPTRPARLRRAPRPHVARGHTNAACPPASCPSASCRPRPHQRGLPACVVPLGLMSPEATPTRPARLHPGNTQAPYKYPSILQTPKGDMKTP